MDILMPASQLYQKLFQVISYPDFLLAILTELMASHIRQNLFPEGIHFFEIGL